MNLVASISVGILLSVGVGSSRPETFVLGEPFTLAIGETIVSTNGALSVRFIEVLSDSRCPSRVRCISAGFAEVRLELTESGHLEEVVASIWPNPESGVANAEILGRSVRLVELSPHPDESPLDLKTTPYVATIIVR